MSYRRRKWVGSGGVIFWLAVSLVLHGALLAVPSFSPSPERPANPVEVGLLPLDPRLAGERTAGEALPPRIMASSLSSSDLSTSPVAAPVTPDIESVATGPVPPSPPAPPPATAMLTPDVEPLPTVPAGPAPTDAEVSPPRPAGPVPAERPQGAEDSGPGAAPATVPLTEALPRYDRNDPPHYPRLARKNGWEGEALLRVTVTEAGGVRAVEIERSSGYPVLDRAALQAVRRWHFHPARRGEMPVAGEVRVPVRFELRWS